MQVSIMNEQKIRVEFEALEAARHQAEEGLWIFAARKIPGREAASDLEWLGGYEARPVAQAQMMPFAIKLDREWRYLILYRRRPNPDPMQNPFSWGLEIVDLETRERLSIYEDFPFSFFRAALHAFETCDGRLPLWEGKPLILFDPEVALRLIDEDHEPFRVGEDDEEDE